MRRTLVPFLAFATFPAAACTEAPPVALDASTAGDSVPSGAGVSITGGGGVTTVTMVLPESSGFEVELVGRECAAPANTVSLLAPLAEVLTGAMCQVPVGKLWSFPEVYPAGTGVTVTFESGATIVRYPPGIDLQGAWPAWTLRFEDGYDQDFNDFTLEVRAKRMDCEDVERATPTTCRIETPVDAVLGWEFTGQLPFVTGRTVISSSSTQTTWSGIAVNSGMVKATVVVGGDTIAFRDSLDVSPRPWSWGADDWKWTERGGDPACGKWSKIAQPPPLSLGLNTRMSICRAGSVDPSVELYPDSGFVADTVSSGPNHGLIYIAAARYHMDRGSVVNPWALEAAPTDAVTGGRDRSLCRRARGLGPQDVVAENFYTYNVVCRGHSLEPLMQGVWDHEGFGTAGPGAAANGHEARRYFAAADPANDPRRRIEHLVQPHYQGLLQTVKNTVWDADREISNFANDHGYVANNYCGQDWVYSPATGRYELVTILQGPYLLCI